MQLHYDSDLLIFFDINISKIAAHSRALWLLLSTQHIYICRRKEHNRELNPLTDYPVLVDTMLTRVV